MISYTPNVTIDLEIYTPYEYTFEIYDLSRDLIDIFVQVISWAFRSAEGAQCQLTMSAPTLKVGCLCSLLAIFVAYIYNKQYVEDVLTERLYTVTEGLLKVEQKYTAQSRVSPKVAVGFGACKDLFTDGLKLLKRLNEEHTDRPRHHNSIANTEQLLRTFSFFFRHGAAAE